MTMRTCQGFLSGKHDFGYVSHRLVELHLVATAELLFHRACEGHESELEYRNRQQRLDHWLILLILIQIFETQDSFADTADRLMVFRHHCLAWTLLPLTGMWRSA